MEEEGLVQQAVSQVPEGYLGPDLSWEIIGGLFEVHSTLGPGFVQRIYARACYQELGDRGFQVRAENEMQVVYRGTLVGAIKSRHLRIGDGVMVFPVAVMDIDHIRFDNLKAWMRVESVPLGILANFRAEALRPIVRRV
jgi:GxxExxY protein